MLDASSLDSIEDNIRSLSIPKENIFEAETESGDSEIDKIILETRSLNVLYGGKYAIKDVNLRIPRNSVTAIIGPSRFYGALIG